MYVKQFRKLFYLLSSVSKCNQRVFEDEMRNEFRDKHFGSNLTVLV